MGVFLFKQFSVKNEDSALKVGTDGVLLGCLAGTGRKNLPLRSIPSQPAADPPVHMATGGHGFCTQSRPGLSFKVLDIGTGTGVVALMLSQRLCVEGIPAQIVGIDIDEASAREAAQNFALSPWPHALCARHCSLAQFLSEAAAVECQSADAVECQEAAAGFGAAESYSLIVSNPPFFDDSLQNQDARESAARHTLSLSYREICEASKILLMQGGELSMILPAEVERDLVRTAASFGLQLQRVVRIRTTARKPFKRIVVSFVKGQKPGGVQQETLLLCDPASTDGRTQEYRNLLRPFLVTVD